MKNLQLITTAPVDVEARAGDPKKLPKVAALVYGGGALRVPGWYSPVVIDLAGLKARDPLTILLDHDGSKPVGQGRAVIGDKSVEVAATLTARDDENVQKVLNHAAGGFQWSASVGVRVDRSEFVAAGASVIVNGRAQRGPLTVARSGVLQEVSLVAIGADDEAAATIAASYAQEVQHMQETTTEVDAALVVERERVAHIEAICKGVQGCDEIRAAALAGEIDERELSRRLLAHVRAARPNVSGTTTTRGHSPAQKGDVLAAALLKYCGRADVGERAYGAATMEAADDLRVGSLHDLAAAALTLEHQTVPRGRGEMLKAAFSTLSMPVALGNAAHKLALAAYQAAPSAWRRCCRVVPVTNYKDNSFIRLNVAGDFDVLPPGGELKHAQAGEQPFSVKAELLGKVLVIDEQIIKNDDAGVLADAATAVGRAGARAVADAFIRTVLSGVGSHFTSGNGNYDSGTDTPLSIDSFGAAVALLRGMTDADGRPIDVEPRTLLVPPALEAIGRRILTSVEVNNFADETSATAPVGNAWYKSAELAVDPRLSNETFTGASAKHWLLFGPTDASPVLMAFVDGAEEPQVEIVDLPIDQLGIGLRGTIRFGCALADPAAAVYMKGEN
ncbi:MAG: Mu-like prophage major head subunit gpT family protein [Phycisphaerales bacterium]|nr:Mu-like prophage major head subunit gpT family protein [Phycisphaerales bacterium]